MSLSSLRMRFSRRSRSFSRASSRSSGDTTSVSRCAVTHLFSVESPTPKSSATCRRVSPLVSAIRTASLRNSSVRFSPIVSLLCCSKCYQRSGTKTRQDHPWTNGQVERINRTIKEATVKRFHYENHDELRTHLTDFMAAYNFARRLKTINGLTPYEYICKTWTSEPDRFILNPIHQMPGLNT